jgi:hypothetical protein
MSGLKSTIEKEEGIFDAEAATIEGRELEKLDRLARWMDDLIRIPILNIRIGLDPIIGAVPWVGDTATAIFSLYLIGSALYYRVPKIVILRMAINVGFDYLMGIIPFIGDASDFFIKSNRWNLNLLREHAGKMGAPRFSDYLFLFAVIGALILLITGGITFVFYALYSAGKLW